MTNSIEILDLSKKYNDFSLKNISFSLKQGSIMGFIGENGAGKTTTIKALLNIITKDSGTIKILGLDSIKDECKIKEQIGVVLDECYFHDSLNVISIETFMKKIYANWNHSIYMNYIDKFNLPAKKRIKEYSRGMKMKLSIAAALAHSPRLLILDEATSGLDPVIRNEILDVFFEFIQNEDHSILMSSHITNDLEKIADYITFIRNGEIVFCNSKDDILDNYAIIKCSKSDYSDINTDYISGLRENKFGYEILINNKQLMKKKYCNLIIDNATLEDIMLLYGKENRR